MLPFGSVILSTPPRGMLVYHTRKQPEALTLSTCLDANAEDDCVIQAATLQGCMPAVHPSSLARQHT